MLIARALLQDAPLLLLDEPFTGVDRASEAGLLAILDELRAEGRGLLVSTHDIEHARRWDRVLCLNGAQIAFGPPADDADRGGAARDVRRGDGHARRGDRHRALPPRPRLMELLESELLRRALAEVVAARLVCGPLGVWILHLRHTYAAESLAHAMLPGLVLAALAGLPLVLGAAGGIVVAALLIALAARDRRIGSELAVAVTVGALFGLGVALALAPDTPARLVGAAVRRPAGRDGRRPRSWRPASGSSCSSRWASAVARCGVTAFDPGARGRWACRRRRTSAGLLVLLGVAIVASVQGLGNLLVLALLVAPAAAALRASDRLVVQLRLAALLRRGRRRGRDGAVVRGRRGRRAVRGAGGVCAGRRGVAAAGRRAAPRARRGPIEGLAGGR